MSYPICLKTIMNATPSSVPLYCKTSFQFYNMIIQAQLKTLTTQKTKKMTAQKLRLLSTYIWKGQVANLDLIKDIIDTHNIIPLTSIEKERLWSNFNEMKKNNTFMKKEHEKKEIEKKSKKKCQTNSAICFKTIINDAPNNIPLSCKTLFQFYNMNIQAQLKTLTTQKTKKMTAQKLTLLSTYIWKGRVANLDLIKDIVDIHNIVPLTSKEKSILRSNFDRLKTQQFDEEKKSRKKIIENKKAEKHTIEEIKKKRKIIIAKSKRQSQTNNTICSQSKSKQQFIDTLIDRLQNEMNQISTQSFRTRNGKTQQSESQSITIIKAILCRWRFTEISRKQKDDSNIFKPGTFYINSSQKPNDFIIKLNNDLIIELEVKKTNSNVVILNDTAPFHTDYIIICSKKKLKHPRVLYINGRTVKKEAWVDKYVQLIDKAKQLAKQGKQSMLRAYPRPNYSMVIKGT